MLKVVEGTFTAEQLKSLQYLAKGGSLTQGKNHVYVTPEGDLMWVSQYRYNQGDYDHPMVLGDKVKLGVIRYTWEG